MDERAVQQLIMCYHVTAGSELPLNPMHTSGLSRASAQSQSCAWLACLGKTHLA